MWFGYSKGHMRDVVILIGENPELRDQVRQLVVQAGAEWNPIWSTYAVAISISATTNRGYNSIDTTDWETWYQQNEPWDTWPVVDVRDGIHLLENFINETPTEQGTMPTKPRVIIETNNNVELSAKVAKLARLCGYALPGTTGRDAHAGIRLEPNDMGSHSSSASTYAIDSESYGIASYPNRFNASTQWPQLLALLRPLMPKQLYVATNDSRMDCARVQRMAFAAGYRWASGATTLQNYAPSYMDIRSRLMYQSPGPEGSCTCLDMGVATDVQLLADWLGAAGLMESTIDDVVSVELLSMIRANPDSEMVKGFIRRDLLLALPREVQDKGADAICGWIMEQKKIEVPAAPPKPATPPQDVVFKIELDFQTTGVWRQTDTITYEGLVPADVVARAQENDDPEIIEEWMVQHRSGLRELGRLTGDHHLSDGDDEEYSAVNTDDISVSDQMEELTNRGTEEV